MSAPTTWKARLLPRAVRELGAWMIRRAGWDLFPASGGPLTMRRGLAWLAARAPARTVIDVGASDGGWTREAARAWPAARFLLIEAQGGVHGPSLERLAQRERRVAYVLAAAGDRVGTVAFDADLPFGGSARRGGGPETIQVPMTTVDAEVRARCLGGPYVLKLDTHGFEVPILHGADATLREAAALVIEVYNFPIAEGALRFPELCRFMEERGFLPGAIVDVLYRPGDGTLWQFDCIFLRADRPEFSVRTFRGGR